MNTLSNQNQQQTSTSQNVTGPLQQAASNIIENFKGLSINNSSQYSSVPSQIMHNKENKKANDTSITSKFVLQPREFGKEITNASSNSNVSQADLCGGATESSKILSDKVGQQLASIGGTHLLPIPQQLTVKAKSSTQSTNDHSNARKCSALSTDNSHISSSSSLHSRDSVEGVLEEDLEKEDDIISIKKETAEEIRERCKERLVQGRKTIIKGLVLSDQLDMRNPQSTAEYASEIYQSMKRIETDNKVDHDYLSKVQSEIKDTSRAFLVEWIIDVHRKFRLMPETLHVTVSIIDRYLSICEIKKAQLHLLGVTALLISTKYEEIYPPELKDLLSISENKFTKAEVLTMETEILTALDFNFTLPSSLRFLERYRKLSTTASDDQIFFFAQYLSEISLLDASLLKYKQSEIAAASLILSAKAIKRINAWNKEMERNTGYKEEDLKEAIEDVKSFAYEVNPKFLSTLKYKFSKPEYFEVANIPFKF